jgi:hypothetical protein
MGCILEHYRIIATPFFTNNSRVFYFYAKIAKKVLF